MFSHRVPHDLKPNRLTHAVERARREGRTLIDLTVSNPTRVGFEYPANLLEPLADGRGLEYAPQPLGNIDARRAVARDYARRGIDVQPERIVLTSSTSEAYSLLFKLFADAGDDVLVPRPSYPLFEHLARFELLALRPYDLEYHGAWTVDFESLDRAATPRSRAVLVVSPNNPTGSFISQGDLTRLAAWCRARGIPLIADEVFADYELEPGSAAGAGKPLGLEDMVVCSLGGLSKTAGLPQLKLGWIAVAAPPNAVFDILERLELLCDSYLSVSTPVQLAAPELLQDGAGIRSQIAARVGANYRRLAVSAADSPACRLLRAEGGWYAILQVPTFGSEEDLVVDLVERDQVVAHPGYFFDFARESFVVVSLLPAAADFAEGIDRILRRFRNRPD